MHQLALLRLTGLVSCAHHLLESQGSVFDLETPYFGASDMKYKFLHEVSPNVISQAGLPIRMQTSQLTKKSIPRQPKNMGASLSCSELGYPGKECFTSKEHLSPCYYSVVCATSTAQAWPGRVSVQFWKHTVEKLLYTVLPVD